MELKPEALEDKVLTVQGRIQEDGALALLDYDDVQVGQRLRVLVRFFH